jgi:hypothetical protein
MYTSYQSETQAYQQCVVSPLLISVLLQNNYNTNKNRKGQFNPNHNIDSVTFVTD